MSLLADALQPFLVRQLAAIRGRMDFMSLADVITSSTVGYDLSFDDADQSITVDFREPNYLTTALAADSCRFAASSFQTISLAAAEMMERDSVAWSLVKLYYSAFYAGHALTRLFGEGCSYFDRSHIVRLTEIADILGLQRSFAIESGLYRCTLNQTSTALKCVRARAGSGGAHEAFWAIFGMRVRAISEAVLEGGLTRADAQAAFAKLDSFSDIIRRRTGFSWLSGMRNDVQYRHQFGVWFPAQLRMPDRRFLSGLARDWQRDPMQIDLNVGRVDPLGEFVACCIFVVALCYAMLERIAERSTAGAKSFVLLGPMAFVNDIGARADGG